MPRDFKVEVNNADPTPLEFFIHDDNRLEIISHPVVMEDVSICSDVSKRLVNLYRTKGITKFQVKKV